MASGQPKQLWSGRQSLSSVNPALRDSPPSSAGIAWQRSRRSRFSRASPVSPNVPEQSMDAQDASNRFLTDDTEHSTKDRPLYRGAESRQKLQNITIDIRRTFPVEGPPIRRNLKPKDLVLSRRPGEGATPLSRRKEFGVILPVDEERHITTSTPPHRGASREERRSRSRSESRSSTPHRYRTRRSISRERRSGSRDRSRGRRSYSRSRSRGRRSSSRSRSGRRHRSRDRRRSHSRSRRSRSRSSAHRPRRALIEKRYPLRRRSRSRSPRRHFPFHQPYEMMQFVPVAVIPRAFGPRSLVPPPGMVRPPPYMRPRYPPGMFRPMWPAYMPRYPPYHAPPRVAEQPPPQD